MFYIITQVLPDSKRSNSISAHGMLLQYSTEYRPTLTRTFQGSPFPNPHHSPHTVGLEKCKIYQRPKRNAAKGAADAPRSRPAKVRRSGVGDIYQCMDMPRVYVHRLQHDPPWKLVYFSAPGRLTVTHLP
jgi:hypothetical protein